MTANHDTSEPAEMATRIIRYARSRLGGASVELLSDKRRQVHVLSRMRHGESLEDAVLAEVHAAAPSHPRVADEFLASLLGDLHRLGHRLRPLALERFLDTEDLVQSVLGDAWPQLAEVEFRGRARLLAYLGRRLGWKASDRHRAAHAEKRREDLRDDDAETDLAEDSARSPSFGAVHQEERERLALLVLRLPARDRELLLRFLRGASVDALAADLELSPDAARMALKRAIERARRLA